MNFPKDSKPYDREHPIHRINSPSYDELRPRASGNGAACGCRAEADYVLSQHAQDEGMGLRESQAPKLLRVLPAWVPVERTVQAPGAVEVEREIEGRLALSQHPSEDFPLGQWHLWYDWNFFVEPALGFEYIRGMDTHDDDEDRIRHGTVECEWDCGAFGDYDYASGSRVPTNDVSAPFFNRDWAWPVGGEYIWLAGRWIYDCGHAEPSGNYRSELHPLKAVAAGRWEAFKFDENERHVPAMQFMFFACRNGGYWDFPSISDADYEFIVDLPEAPAPPDAYPIGHTPEFPFNTIVVRPRLLVKLDYAPFSSARTPVAAAGAADPEIELLPPATPGAAPSQVKVKVPLSRLGKGVSSYGVIASLGWHDPQREQAQKIKEVQIKFLSITVAGDTRRFIDNFFFRHLPGEPGGIGGTLRFVWRIGVNGRWHGFDFPDTSVGTRQFRLDLDQTLFLAEDDDIRITCTGIEEDPGSEMLRRKLDGRTVKGAGNVPFRWDTDIDTRDAVHVSAIARQMVNEGLVDAITSLSLVTSTSNDLGKVIPGLPMGQDSTPNPLKVKDLVTMAGGPRREVRAHLVARTRAGKTTMPPIDYTLHYEMSYRDLLN